MNFDVLKSFSGGYSTDLNKGIHKEDTFQKGINGRLYSIDGVLSFNAIRGSKLIYENPDIVKYLGYWDFEDEVIVFVKVLKNVENRVIEVETVSNFVSLNPFTITESSGQNTIFMNNEFSENSQVSEVIFRRVEIEEDQYNFNPTFSCVDNEGNELDLSDYYKVDRNVPNLIDCVIDDSQTPIHNEKYLDAIYSLKINEEGALYGELLWVGMQNWPLDSKISCEGIIENEFISRVYYTDAFNKRRVVNIKDPELLLRKANEFDQFSDVVLLKPIIVEQKDGGSLKAMNAQYMYRVISENGIVSQFSPASDYVPVLKSNESPSYAGGGIGEFVSKMVIVDCPVFYQGKNALVECIAIEYEASGGPTAIRSLGLKPLSPVVRFTHTGNEVESIGQITISDLTELKNTWKFCNSFSSEKNKLIAGGLRNEVIPSEISNLDYLFALHGWDLSGNTHKCLMNPEPWKYKYINPKYDGKVAYASKRSYRNISSFGPLTIRLENKVTGYSIRKRFDDLPIDRFSNILEDVYDWVYSEYYNSAEFGDWFPNLKIDFSNGRLLFLPENESIQTDMNDYLFSSNNDQFLEDFSTEISYLDIPFELQNLIPGAQSIGFNDGNGVRITFKRGNEPLLKKANEPYNGSTDLLDFFPPSGNKYFQKGEIYRLGIQFYSNDSTRLFTVPLGDIIIPDFGSSFRALDDYGNIIIEDITVNNQYVSGDVLFGSGIKVKVEVRLSCELQKHVSSYEIVYVERTPENRTIVTQGIAQPLIRINTTHQEPHYKMPDQVTNKWVLPYMGGPGYDMLGLEATDDFGVDYNTNTKDVETRVMVARNLFYVDSPEIYYGKIPSNLFEGSEIKMVDLLSTDHEEDTVYSRGISDPNDDTYGDIYRLRMNQKIRWPKFSRKIRPPRILEELHEDEFLKPNFLGGGAYQENMVNVSVFSKSKWMPPKRIKIEKFKELNRGEVISGSALSMRHDISNNAFMLPSSTWFFGYTARYWGDLANGDPNESNIWAGTTLSPGYPTVVVKSKTDLFSPDITQANKSVFPNDGQAVSNMPISDYTPLINIVRNNRDSVYGGRSEYAYSQNQYKSLGKVIPVLKNSNASQYFDIGGDVYLTLNVRLKNDYDHDVLFKREYTHGDSFSPRLKNVWNTKAAWIYAVVLESMVEPKMTHDYEVYRDRFKHSFLEDKTGTINSGYLQDSQLRSFIPKPFRFKDDPDLGNVIAVSDVKLSGQPRDSWTVFKPNNFYAELEKSKGDVSNLVRVGDKVYAIQKSQTSEIVIGADRVFSDSEGNPLNIKQGSGLVVETHRVISPHGTSIRNGVRETPFGFFFFDESKNEFVKNGEPLFQKHLLHLHYGKEFRNVKVIDSSPFYDNENKESNVRLRLTNGNNFIISYNEMLGLFNGEYQMDNDLYFTLNQKLYAPITTNDNGEISSKKLHELNRGKILNLFEEDKKLILGFYIHSEITKTFIYPKVAIRTSIKYPIDKFSFRSNLGMDRIIRGDHSWYKIREGIHSVPTINDSVSTYGNAQLRGSWFYLEMEISNRIYEGGFRRGMFQEDIENNKIDILAVINSLRLSHQ